METLLMVAVVLIALAIVTQAGVLIAMYLMSRRISTKAETLMADTKKLIVPLESITSNLKIISDDLAETGKIARQQVLHVQEIVREAQDSIRGQIFEVRERVLDTVDEARDMVMRPIRQYSAIASGIAAGIRTFFGGRHQPVETETTFEQERQYPAA